MYTTIALVLYLALGSVSLGYLFLRIGWPSIRKLDESYKVGWSIILGLVFSAVAGITSFVLGFFINLWVAPAVITASFLAMILVLNIRKRIPKIRPVKVSFPKNYLSAKRIAEAAHPASAAPVPTPLILKTKMNEEQKAELRKFLQRKQAEEETKKRREYVDKVAENVISRIEKGEQSISPTKVSVKEGTAKIAPKEIAKTADTEKLSPLEMEIKAAVSAAKTKADKKIEEKAPWEETDEEEELLGKSEEREKIVAEEWEITAKKKEAVKILEEKGKGKMFDEEEEIIPARRKEFSGEEEVAESGKTEDEIKAEKEERRFAKEEISVEAQVITKEKVSSKGSPFFLGKFARKAKSGEELAAESQLKEKITLEPEEEIEEKPPTKEEIIEEPEEKPADNAVIQKEIEKVIEEKKGKRGLGAFLGRFAKGKEKETEVKKAGEISQMQKAPEPVKEKLPAMAAEEEPEYGELHKKELERIRRAEAEKMPKEETADRGDELEGRFEEELLSKVETGKGYVPAKEARKSFMSEEEKEAIRKALVAAKERERNRDEMISKQIEGEKRKANEEKRKNQEEEKKKREVAEIFGKMKEMKVGDILAEGEAEKKDVPRRMHRYYREGTEAETATEKPFDEEGMAESLYEQLKTERVQETPEKEKIRTAINQEVAEKAEEVMERDKRRHAIGKAMQEVKSFKEREGRYPSAKEENEITKQVTSHLNEQFGAAPEAAADIEKFTPRQRHALREQEAQKISSVKEPAKTGASFKEEKLTRRELRKRGLEGAKKEYEKEVDEEDKGILGKIQREGKGRNVEDEIEEVPDISGEGEDTGEKEPEMLEEKVDLDAPAKKKINEMKVKELFEEGEKESLELSDIDAKEDEFDLKLEDVEDVDNLQKEVETEKNKCPTCNSVTYDLIFCPECGAGFCPHCAKQAKKIDDKVQYTCPKCNYELKVKENK